MMLLCLAIIALLAALSLVANIHAWRDIQAGNPYILSLRQVTRIMDRARLQALFGQCDARYLFTLSAHQRKVVVRLWGLPMALDMAGDVACMAGVYYYGVIQPPGEAHWFFISFALWYQSLGFWDSWRQVKAWRHQIDEELGIED
jgi:hypothetical protein